jgi:hypothetical protein
VIAPSELERAYPALLDVKPSRSVVEYYFTCTPFLPGYVFDAEPTADLVTYLDADLYFFDSPEPIFDELGAGSVAIVEHRFPPPLRERERYGRFNVGWVTFRRDEAGLACLAWWGERCLEWCFDRPEEDRFADQKYLDQWPARFPGVVVIRHPGANLAPWNLASHAVGWDGRSVTVDGRPLLFFHFHALRSLRPWLYDSSLRNYYTRMTATLLWRVYRPYLTALRRAERALGARRRGRPGSDTTRPNPGSSVAPAPPVSLVARAGGPLQLARKIWEHEFLVCPDGRPICW